MPEGDGAGGKSVSLLRGMKEERRLRTPSASSHPWQELECSLEGM